MATGYGLQDSTGGLVQRVAGIVAATTVAAAIVVSVPTPASAFNIGGLIGSALAMRYGGGGGGYHHHSRSAERHHSRSRVASRRHHESDQNSAAEEKDGAEVDATAENSHSNGKANIGAPAKSQPSGPVNNVEQASASDEPSFTPSR